MTVALWSVVALLGVILSARLAVRWALRAPERQARRERREAKRVWRTHARKIGKPVEDFTPKDKLEAYGVDVDSVHQGAPELDVLKAELRLRIARGESPNVADAVQHLANEHGVRFHEITVADAQSIAWDLPVSDVTILEAVNGRAAYEARLHAFDTLESHGVDVDSVRSEKEAP